MSDPQGDSMGGPPRPNGAVSGASAGMAAGPTTSSPPNGPIPPAVNTDAGLGRPPATPIATLPPLPPSPEGLALSEKTGQPRREPWAVAAGLLLYLGAGINAVGYGVYWWNAMHVDRWPGVARLVEWTHPRPGSGASIAVVVALAAIAAIVSAAPAIASFNAWNGYRWSRWAAVAAAGLSLLSLLGAGWAWWCIPPIVVGAALLWLPIMERYFTQWEAFRTPQRPEVHQPVSVVYGPLPRYR